MKAHEVFLASALFFISNTFAYAVDCKVSNRTVDYLNSAHTKMANEELALYVRSNQISRLASLETNPIKVMMIYNDFLAENSPASPIAKTRLEVNDLIAKLVDECFKQSC